MAEQQLAVFLLAPLPWRAPARISKSAVLLMATPTLLAQHLLQQRLKQHLLPGATRSVLAQTSERVPIPPAIVHGQALSQEVKIETTRILELL